jgi:fructose transport system ATP-binding protein
VRRRLLRLELNGAGRPQRTSRRFIRPLLRGVAIVLISHNMPHVFEVADRIHIHRLGGRLCVINRNDYTMSDAVAFMTGAHEPPIPAK